MADDCSNPDELEENLLYQT